MNGYATFLVNTQLLFFKRAAQCLPFCLRAYEFNSITTLAIEVFYESGGIPHSEAASSKVSLKQKEKILRLSFRPIGSLVLPILVHSDALA